MQTTTDSLKNGDWIRGMSFSGAPIVGFVTSVSGGADPIEDPRCAMVDGRSSSGDSRVRMCDFTMIERIETLAAA